MAFRRFLYFLLIIALISFHIFFIHYISFFMLVFVLVLPIISLCICLLSKKSLMLSMKCKKSISEKNKEIPIIIEAINDRTLLPNFVKICLKIENVFNPDSVEEQLSLIVGKDKQTFSHTISSKYSGQLKITATKIKIYDPLGLFSFKYKKDFSLESVTVMPNIYEIETDISSENHDDVDSGEYSKEKPGWDLSESFEIREYRSGDSVKKIHWKLSGKLDKTMVREGSLPISSLGVLFFALEGSGEEHDKLTDAFFSLSSTLAENAIAHKYIWQNGKSLECETIASVEDIERNILFILSAPPSSLALKAYRNEDFHIAQESKIVFFCDSLDDDIYDMLCEKFSQSPIEVFFADDNRKTEKDYSNIYIHKV